MVHRFTEFTGEGAGRRGLIPNSHSNKELRQKPRDDDGLNSVNMQKTLVHRIQPQSSESLSTAQDGRKASAMTTTTVKTTTPIDAFLEHIRQDFDDDGLRLIFADYLDEHLAPTPVTVGHLPNWLRVRFHRDRPVYFIDTWATLHSSMQAVWDAIKEYLQRTGTDRRGTILDHAGSTVVGGHLAFVAEPYAGDEEALRCFRGLAEGLGCIDAFTRQSWHSQQHPSAKGCVRILLFPPTAGLRPEDAKAVNRKKPVFTGWVHVGGKWEAVRQGQRNRRVCVEWLYRAIAQRDVGEWACAITTNGKPPAYVPHDPYATHQQQSR
jgi:uncharacterized protein (TIGR02996 family)